ncbi:MAG: FAD-binding oxidoreductase [Candidatus Wallbacteria bacterium]|nr:FAD-binding oxidoreductase [Candidatus Wallbacteria bacterium]
MKLFEDFSRLKIDFSSLDSDRLLYSYDASPHESKPLAVCWPESSSDLSKIVKYCSKQSLPVYPRGAGTAMTGSPLAVKPGIVVSFEKMRKILEFSPENMMVTVQPGVITGELKKFCLESGFYYPPDPASASVCTIGGNLSTNAGGIRSLKYGTTRSYLLGLKYINHQGREIILGTKNLRYALGYPLHQLFCGAEGTLGLISEITLRVIPAPLAFRTAYLGFRDLKLLTEFGFKFLPGRGITPAILEFMDQTCQKAVELREKANWKRDNPYAVLIQLDGRSVEKIDGAWNMVRKFAGKNRLDFTESTDNGNEFLRWRKGLMSAFANLRPGVLGGDLVVPRARLQDFVSKVEKLHSRFKVQFVLFGHIGDGNLHPNVLFSPDDKSEVTETKLLFAKLHAIALDLGGAVSGEHGIGIERRGFLKKNLGKDAVNLMKEVKAIFDPQGIFNPGKIISE